MLLYYLTCLRRRCRTGSIGTHQSINLKFQFHHPKFQFHHGEIVMRFPRNVRPPTPDENDSNSVRNKNGTTSTAATALLATTTEEMSYSNWRLRDKATGVPSSFSCSNRVPRPDLGLLICRQRLLDFSRLFGLVQTKGEQTSRD